MKNKEEYLELVKDIKDEVTLALSDLNDVKYHLNELDEKLDALDSKLEDEPEALK